MAQISVIVPVYQVEAYLDRCVQSILHQSFPDFEMILVDDGSPDNCPALCDQYARQDHRVHVIHQENGGLSAARNTGIDYVMSHSQSPWITFLDSDDWVHREYLERLLAGAGKPGVGVSACGFARVSAQYGDEALNAPRPVLLTPESAYVQYYGMLMTACCKLIRRDLLEGVRFPLGKLHEDAFVTHLFAFGGEKVAVLEEPLYYYYFNPDSITRRAWSPRRLEELEGHRVREDYLKARGYERAWRAEQTTLLTTIYEHTEAMALLKEPRYAETFRDLRRQLREEVRLGKELGTFRLNRETVWIFLMACPALPLWRLGKKLQSAWHRFKLRS